MRRRSGWGVGNARMEFVAEVGGFDLWWDNNYTVVTVVECKYSSAMLDEERHDNNRYVDINVDGRHYPDNTYKEQGLPVPLFPPEVLIRVYEEFDKRGVHPETTPVAE